MVNPVTMFNEGGPFMYFILTAAVFAMAIAFERLFYIIFRANINSTAFMAQIQKLIMANNIDRAIKLCNAEPHAALPRVVKAGLTRANRTEKEIENAIDEATLEVGPFLNKRTPYLSMLANVATLLGLLGTIFGLIMAFDAVAHASAEMKSTLLSAGIAVAMFTTAGGLMVAIPTLVLHSIVLQRTNKILDDVDQYGVKTVNLLTARRRGTLKDEVAVES
ncbi:MAG: MotA/TolQ/ExbB proton channel family protein [Deltaproteobacteria bacterium]|nr:MotA/TolQ/ExbB proton channel family protein [Deltaproteobacteria bacterium]MBW2252963.1 MotA/TolQ/ExbB proton channel family protein [Deltaproteobacteria bacterium]